MATGFLRIEYAPLSDVRRWPTNPKRHDEEGIAGSVDRWGFNDPLVIDERTGQLVEGHGRLTALAGRKAGGQAPPAHVELRADGEWLIPVVRGVSFDSEADAEAYIAAHNQLTIAGGFDEKRLAPILARAREAKIPAGILGFRPREMDRIIASLARGGAGAGSGSAGSSAPATERIDELAAKWRTSAGQVWVIPSRTTPGRSHRVACADCRSDGAALALVAGAPAAIAFTSPPYAAQREYDDASGFRRVPPDEYVAWFEGVQAGARQVLAADGSWFVNIKEHADDGQRSLYVKDLTLAHVRRWGWRFVDEFAWTRGGVPGAWPNRFKNGWEPGFHFSVERAIKFRPDAVAKESPNSFKYSPANATSRSGSGFLSGVAGGTHEGMALPTNVVSIPTGGNRVTGDHPAEFPLELPAFFLQAFTDAGDLVYDPFMGSGTTLVAAEHLGRLACGFEISPGYLALILERASSVGLEPRLA